MAMRGLLADYRAHIIVGTLLLVFVVLPLLWFALAYGGLPRLWSHHERRKGRPDGDAVSYTAQGIPADPINLKVLGSQDRIDCARTGRDGPRPIQFPCNPPLASQKA